MKVLVIGQGGREHALVRALRLSSSVSEVHVTPGSAGMAREALCHSVGAHDLKGLGTLLSQHSIDLVVVGPEVPLTEGLADFVRGLGIEVFGPSQAAARLEGSKIFAKEFMVRGEVPTARFTVVQSVEETMRRAGEFAPPYILKADGLAAGKGVLICSDLDELRAAAVTLFEDQIFGSAGSKAVLEENLPGWELSYLVLTNGEDFEAFPLAQDHKRLFDKDQGPNTGGMGTIAPISITDELDRQIRETIIRPSIQQIKSEGLDFRGVLFVGIMVTDSGPKVLEYNVRFGDPESQVILPLLDGDWGSVMADVAQGRMPRLMWKPMAAACIVLAAEGYPDNPIKGVTIGGNIQLETPSSYFLHAGTTLGEDGAWKTNGGRVLNAVGVGSSLDEALRHAYEQAQAVHWPGMQFRHDIGARQL